MQREVHQRGIHEPDEAGVIRACKPELAEFELPKRVVFIDELPRNTMAEIQKFVVRALPGSARLSITTGDIVCPD